jgi:hypothetical protein
VQAPSITSIALGVFIVGLLVLEVWAFITKRKGGGSGATISVVTRRASKRWPIITLLFGILSGHLFWPLCTIDDCRDVCDSQPQAASYDTTHAEADEAQETETNMSSSSRSSYKRPSRDLTELRSAFVCESLEGNDVNSSERGRLNGDASDTRYSAHPRRIRWHVKPDASNGAGSCTFTIIGVGE